MGNQIRQLETRALAGPHGDVSAIMCALDVGDAAAADGFVKDVLDQVLVQRMISPPDTSFMLVTIIGELAATDFARLWSKHLATEPAMAAFMTQMTKADVLQGDARGQILGQASLI
jgi:hypothetical protein